MHRASHGLPSQQRFEAICAAGIQATIGEAVDITPTGYENKTDDGTNLQSSAVERVFTIADGGTWDFTANRVSTDTGQAAMATATVSHNVAVS